VNFYGLHDKNSEKYEQNTNSNANVEDESYWKSISFRGSSKVVSGNALEEAIFGDVNSADDRRVISLPA
jgi:hypothetical protein